MKKLITLFIILMAYTSSGQSLSVFDVDTTDFPIMRAKFYATDSSGNQITNLNESDFKITENGEERNVLSVSCPTLKEPEAISSVLTIDVSGSMSGNNIEMAKEASKAWVNGLPLGRSECAITSFNETNQYIQDFTTDRNRLLNKINTLTAGGGTDFNAAFVNPLAGGLLALEKAKYKKVMVLITDGYASGNENQILSKAQSIGATVYCVTIGYKCPDILKNISEQTGGKWFENVTTVEEAIKIYSQLLIFAQENEPCEIEWESDINCEFSRYTQIKYLPGNLIDQKYYLLPKSKSIFIEISPSAVRFFNIKPGTTIDTTITFTALFSDVIINDIQSQQTNFDITPKSFTLKKGESRDIVITFKPEDKKYKINKYEIFKDGCPDNQFIYVSSSYNGNIEDYNTLQVVHPNGGEEFLSGSDTIITWAGITPSDSTTIELSTNSGVSWKNVANFADQNEYKWNIPSNILSQECLVRVSQNVTTAEDILEWKNNIGGSNTEILSSLSYTKDGGCIAGITSYSNDGDMVINKGDGDAIIVKFSANGSKMWQINLGGSGLDHINSIKQTNDMGYILVGFTTSSDGDIPSNIGKRDLWVVKLSTLGEIQWQKIYGGSENDVGNSINQTSDNGYIIAGCTFSNDYYLDTKKGGYSGRGVLGDAWVLKLNMYGDISWHVCIGGDRTDIANDVIETNDQGYAAAITSHSKDYDFKKGSYNEVGWIFKFTKDGSLEWKDFFFGYVDNEFNSIFQTKRNDFIIAGSINNKGLILKIDKNGQKIWSKSIGENGSENFYAIQSKSDTSYIAVGYSSSSDDLFKENKGDKDFWIYRISDNGELIRHESYGGSSADIATVISISPKGTTYVAGYSNSSDGDFSENKGDNDGWILKYGNTLNNVNCDTSDAVFSIVAPEVSSRDIDMGDVVINTSKDSVITSFIDNIGQWDCRIDSIYFEGADADYFKLNGPLPVYTVAIGSKQMAEFKFSPTEVRDYSAQIVIVTQADTIYQNIIGRGVKQQIAANAEIIDFGIRELYNYADTNAVCIYNVSNNPINITKIEMLGPDKEQFLFLDPDPTAPFTLQANTAYNMNLRFNPIYMGRTSGQIAFHFNGAGSPAILQLYGAGIGAELAASSDSAYVGDVIGIDIKFVNNDIKKFAEVIGSFEGVVRVESSILGTLHKEDLVEIKADSAYIKFKGDTNPENSTLATIPLKVALGRMSGTTIDFEYVKWFDTEGNELVYDTDFSSGYFKQLGICEQGGKRLFNPTGEVGISSLSPNPAEDKLQITVKLIEEGQTKLELYNELGNRIRTIIDESISNPGERIFNENLDNVPSGSYTIILTTPSYRQVENLIIKK